MKDYKIRFDEELLKELSDLKMRAIKVGYKNIIPKLPESKANFEQSMNGFHYRLHNWKKQLIQLENPGGLPSHSPKNNINLEETGNFVIDSKFFAEDLSEED